MGEMIKNQITLFIDGLEVIVEKGVSVLEAALKNNIYIPHLCYCPDVKPFGACRLCLVEINGQILPSCLTPVEDGMIVKTKTPDIERIRKVIVELLIANHHSNCRHCPSSGKCNLQKIMGRLRVNVKRMRPLRMAKEKMPIDTSNPVFDYDPNRCILCGVCVQICEKKGNNIANFFGRGYVTRVIFLGDTSKCEVCQQCVTKCPVGALISKKH